MDLADIRLRNTLRLRDHFANTWRAQNDPRSRTIESSFAQLVDLNPSHWSQIKSGHRHVGEKLARQIEVKCKVPKGALDSAEALPSGAHTLPVLECHDDDERRAMLLFQGLYRSNPVAARQKLLAALQGELLDRPDAAGAARGSRASAMHAGPKKR